MEVSWEDHYVRYKKLKKVIKFLKSETRDEFLGSIDTLLGTADVFQDIDNELCDDCIREHIFVSVLNSELDHVESFVLVTRQRLELSFENLIRPSIEQLLDNNPTSRDEPKVRADSPEAQSLAGLATFKDTVQVLLKFIVVNEFATTKIKKKFEKQLSPCCCNNSSCRCSKVSQISKKIAAQHVCKLQRLLMELHGIDSRLMIKSTVYHDFLAEQVMLLENNRIQNKLNRLESKAALLTRLSKHIDIEHGILPASSLAIGVTLPLVTLAVTYYISANIYVGEGVTIFDKKGYFISSSIDRPPASNIGTLGLTTTLALLSNIIFIKHKIVTKQLRSRRFMRSHRVATIFGLMSTFCGNGVSAFQHNDAPVAHNSFAASFFVFGMIHVLMETYTDITHKLSPRNTGWWRALIAGLLVLCVIGFLGPMVYVIYTGMEKIPELRHESLFLKKIAATFEVAAFACLVLWFASYYGVLKGSEFNLQIHTRVELDSNFDLQDLRESTHVSRNSTLKKSQ